MATVGRELVTIQKREKLNKVYAFDAPGSGGANHAYWIEYPSVAGDKSAMNSDLITFQNGPRLDPKSTHGVLDADLLEIVRDRLKGVQSGEYACRANACALTHIEEALMWLNRRVEDRIERGVLGTDKV